jgi:hypothetical protein
LNTVSFDCLRRRKYFAGWAPFAFGAAKVYFYAHVFFIEVGRDPKKEEKYGIRSKSNNSSQVSQSVSPPAQEISWRWSISSIIVDVAKRAFLFAM